MRRGMFTTIVYGFCAQAILLQPQNLQAECTAIFSEPVTFTFEVQTLQDPNDPNSVDDGHVHIDVSFNSGGWDFSVKAPGETFLPDAARFYVSEENQFVLNPVPTDYEFIGAGDGEVFWWLPQANPQDLFLGFSASSMDASDISAICQWQPDDDRITNAARWFRVELLEVRVRGPEDAQFAMWQESGASPTVWMSTVEGGITHEDAYYVFAGTTCSHVNWSFTHAGTYEIDFEVSTVYDCDDALTADLDDDCHVDMADFSEFSYWWQMAGCGECGGADLDKPADGDVGMSDLYYLAEQWLDCGYPACDE